MLVGAAFGAGRRCRRSRTRCTSTSRPPRGRRWRCRLPDRPQQERAVYSVDGPLVIDGAEVPAHTLAVLAPGGGARSRRPAGARYVVVGGEPLDGPRVIWWNFVASSRERIEAAKDAWRQQRMGAVPGEQEFIPLP